MLLHWEDRNSMAHGIEARVPFLDHRLVEFTIGLGERHKIVGGDTKRVLRRAMERIFPRKSVIGATSSALRHRKRPGSAARCARPCSAGSSRPSTAFRACSMRAACALTRPKCSKAAGPSTFRCGGSSI